MPRPKRAPEPCSVDGCDRRILVWKNRLCAMHYTRWQRYGDPTVVRREVSSNRPKVCVVEGCEEPHRSMGYCNLHYARLRRHGDVGTVRSHRGEHNAQWLGDAIQYSAAHRRLRSWRGSAKEHLCVDCGAQATYWSLRHEDLAVVILVDDRNRGYSPNPEDYDPRCHQCHYRYDHPVRVWRTTVSVTPDDGDTPGAAG